MGAAAGQPILYSHAQQLLMSQSGLPAMMLAHTNSVQDPPPPILPPQSLQGQHLMAQVPHSSAAMFGLASQPSSLQPQWTMAEAKPTTFGDVDHRTHR